MDLQIPSIESLSFEALTFRHEAHDPTLSQADFEFPTGEIVWVKASEGVGKSTLLQLLAGLLVPQQGKYLINSQNVADMSFEEFLPYRMNIGYSFDYGGLINNRTIFDNLMLPLIYHKVLPYNEAKARVDGLIQRFDIKKFRDERPAHVPGRVRKLGCLLRALVLHPQMLLLDDPSVGLGQDTAMLFADVIHELRKSKKAQHIFVSSYDEKFMSLFGYKIIQLNDGLLYNQAVDQEKRVANL